ncbi:flagellar type III secretion system protein FlhB [Pandoraea pulmonicola]|uniref:Flagellar biosynthesis protein FlhB n=1 Tax=Pandoraea pulmonicola TaxID=93221 RepID=A0AAJ5CZV4_PANPU|nr:flagellar type III secretion system protein FlhB [Pandoraea pulmonicola]AJC21380.1 flagellar biosynthesis protein FlhB [Pandoraea pulmonicola]SUA89885.1 Flagellar biosynthetic protein flhB [Pandoraea pulmonicola]
MTAQDTGDKSEAPSAQKLRRAREQGQVARSRDTATAVGIMASVAVLAVSAPSQLDAFRSLYAAAFADLAGIGFDDAWTALLPAAMWLLAKLLAPLAAIPLCIGVAAMLPGGYVFSTTLLKPKWQRLSPKANLGRLVSIKHYAQVGTAILKVALVASVLVLVIRARWDALLALQASAPREAIAVGLDLLRDAVLVLGGAFVAFALLDLPLQRFFFLRDQRMTKQEVKQEHKQTEGRPEVKQRIRQIQRRLAERSLRRTVPTADVVIVNPTHYAIALKYDTGRAQAPFVVARGLDETAAVLRRIAREHGIDVVSAPPLARALYHTSQVNQQIPAALYDAVAVVLAYVLQLRAWRAGERTMQPERPDPPRVPASLSDPPSPQPRP